MNPAGRYRDSDPTGGAEERTIALLAGPDDEAAILRRLETVQDIVVTRRCADHAEVIAAGRSGVATCAIVDGDDPDLDGHVIAAMRGAGMVVVLLGAGDRRGALSALGADAVVDSADPDSVVDAVRTRMAPGSPRADARADAPTGNPSDTRAVTRTGARRESPPAPAASPSAQAPQPPTPGAPDPGRDTAAPASERTSGRILAVWGTSGAPGRSTIAAGLAAIAAERLGEVLLVDADTWAPSQSALLGLNAEASSVGVLARMLARGEHMAPILDRAVAPHPAGFGVLTGLDDPNRWRELTGQGIEAILALAASRSPFVVVDLGAGSLDPPSTRQGPDRDAVIRQALAVADEILCVARADVVGVNRLVHALRWAEDQQLKAPVLTVVNRVSAAATGRNPVRALSATLAPLLPGRSFFLLPEDPAVAADQLRGRAPATTGETPWSRDLKVLARYVVPDPPASTAT